MIKSAYLYRNTVIVMLLGIDSHLCLTADNVAEFLPGTASYVRLISSQVWNIAYHLTFRDDGAPSQIRGTFQRARRLWRNCSVG